MTSNDPQDALDQIKARAEKATEGPWVTQQGTPTMSGNTWTLRVRGMPGIWIGAHEYQHGTGNSEFIAHARTDVQRLVEALEAVHNVVENYPLPYKRDDPTGEIACAIEMFGDAIQDAYTDKLTEGEPS